jgi:HD-GYP domain-containing protein (c-di-GMP phosphodiesterase class II)
VVLERQRLLIPDVNQEANLARAKAFMLEGFVTYYGVPLIAKGQVRGVLEIFHRSFQMHDSEWLDFTESLAGQAAISIDNGAMFDELQRSNLELTLAYEASIDGWSHAMDLRDKETEGHTQRVTQMTLDLARAMHIEGQELAHIRRGAMLHDIGKMGVPDGILLKPEHLDTDEIKLMRKHPEFAYNMLSSIKYLKPSLDIPYCHHEKWDGTGYPRGLAGEQIPLSARLFAVVDVWDAITSNRPYRAAWKREDALQYIREQSGKQFDPAIVQIFLQTIR